APARRHPGPDPPPGRRPSGTAPARGGGGPRRRHRRRGDGAAARRAGGRPRFGAACEAASALVRAVSALPGLVLEGIYTHFANAEDPDDPFTEEQLARFLDVLRPLEADPGLRLTRHAAGSSAVLHWPASRLDAVRPGLLVLGVYPTTKLRRTIAVTPVMRVWARVARCR